MKKPSLVFLALFFLFIGANTAYLHRVPGLFGDEASEGGNVYTLSQAEKLVVRGERSYVGPLVDYARWPLVALFGYGPLALRLLTLMVSVVTFYLAAVVFSRLWGELPAQWAVALMFFSPIYLLYQRLGWAITLFAFFTLLILFCLTSGWKHKWPLAGFAAGLGLHNYILFLPVLVAVATVGVIWRWYDWRRGIVKFWYDWRQWWLAILGFWAGFGTQFAVIQLFAEDQGDPGQVLAQLPERLAALPTLLPQILSGSSYIARYVGVEMSAGAMGVITLILLGLIGLALGRGERRAVSVIWAIGLAIQLIVLLAVIDRFTLRYMVLPSLGVWALAGAGMGQLKLPKWGPVWAALLLMAWMAVAVLIPYLKTGGSAERFSLGNRTDTAIDFVDTRPLVNCLAEVGPVWADNPHVYNRLKFLGYGNESIELAGNIFEAHFIVDYRQAGEPAGVVCEDLDYFRLLKRK